MLVIGIIAIVLARNIAIDKIKVLGAEFTVQGGLKFPYYPRFLWPGLLFFIVGVCALIVARYSEDFWASWPRKFRDLCTAQIQLSEVDDIMRVSINNRLVAESKNFGETTPWIDVTKQLHQGVLRAVAISSFLSGLKITMIGARRTVTVSAKPAGSDLVEPPVALDS